MSVEEKIIENSKEKIKALAPRALKASNYPDTGVKIEVPGAKFVIRDCAKITVDYLPIMLYGHYKDPIKELKGKFTKKEIEIFVVRSKNSIPTSQLCDLMMQDVVNQEVVQEEIQEVATDDIYGDYGSDNAKETTLKFDSDDQSDIIAVLCEAFKVKEK